MAQYKVPQDIQREDQIFGPFTLRQFLFFIGAGIGGYMTFVTIKPFSNGQIAFMAGSIVFAIIGSFAILKIQGMELPEYVTALIIFNTKPKKRVWQRDIFIPDIAYVKNEEQITEEEPPKINPVEIKSRLDQLAHILDTGGWKSPEENKLESISPSATITEVEEPKAPEVEEPKAPEVEEPKAPEVEKISSSIQITNKKQEEIEKLLQVQEKREKLIQQEMNKMEQKLIDELTKKFKKESEEKVKQQSKKIKELKAKMVNIEKSIIKENPTEKIEKAKIRLEPEKIENAPIPDYSDIMKDRITYISKKSSNVNIEVDESKLDDVLSQIENPVTDEDFNKLEKAILSKKHNIKHAKIIKEKESYNEY